MKLGIAGIEPDPDSKTPILLPAWQNFDDEAAQRILQSGYRGTALFVDSPLEADWAAIRRVGNLCRTAGLEVAQANGRYTDLVHPQASERAQGVRALQALVRIGRAWNVQTVYVRPGSLNPRGPWWPHPENRSLEVYDRLIDSLNLVRQTAEAEGMMLAIEGHVLSPLYSVQRVRDLLDAVGSPALKFNMDPVNFIGTVAEVYNSAAVINELFDLLGADTVALHAKDCQLTDALVVHIDEVVPGAGTIDYDLLLTRFADCCPNGYVLIEHLAQEHVPAAQRAILDVTQRLGMNFDRP